MKPLDLKIASAKPLIAVGWQPGVHTGWQVFGLNLLLEIGRRGDRTPLPLEPFDLNGISQPLHHHLLEPAFQASLEFQRTLAQFPGRNFRCDIPILCPLGQHLLSTVPQFRGRPNVGFIFSENAEYDAAALDRAAQFDRILAGSTWNFRILEAHGIRHVLPLFQGVDLTLFHPAPRANWFKDRFVIFSGGKLEYRKGQDIVIAAFKRFHARHPEAFLLTAWQNMWPKTMEGIDLRGHVTGLPTVDRNNVVQIRPWLAANGIAVSDCFDVGFVPNHLMPQVCREADVCLFTSRCEAGTNLVAMECLACGLPTILSANTGHLDLIDSQHCFPLVTQSDVRPMRFFQGTNGWGESCVDDVVARLEDVFHHRDQARERGLRAAQFMQDWSWQKQVARLLAQVDAAG